MQTHPANDHAFTAPQALTLLQSTVHERYEAERIARLNRREAEQRADFDRICKLFSSRPEISAPVLDAEQAHALLGETRIILGTATSLGDHTSGELATITAALSDARSELADAIAMDAEQADALLYTETEEESACRTWLGSR